MLLTNILPKYSEQNQRFLIFSYQVDSNLIWSSRSFIPRSGTFNLTFDLFGEAMNLFEIGGRVEGLETLMETYFGPMGYFNDKDRESNKIPEADPSAARLSSKKFDDIRKQVTSFCLLLFVHGFHYYSSV